MSKGKNSSVNIITMSIALVLLALAGFLYMFWNDAPANAETGMKSLPTLTQTKDSISIDINAMPKTVSDGSGFFSFVVDGITRYDNSGSVKWNYPLSLSNPVFVNNGSFVGTGEYKGRYFYVFGQSGLAYMIESEGEILNFVVAANGYSAVTAASASGGYKVNVYNESGKLITYCIIEDKNNYPVCTAVSPDGKVLAIGYLNLSGVQMESFICAYYIKSSDGIDYSDSMFASFNRNENEIISSLKFVNDQSLMFFSNKNYGIYELTSSSQMKLKWSEEMNNEVSFIDTVNDKYVIVALGKALVNKNGLAEGSVIAKDLEGNEMSNYTIDGPVTYLSCNKEAMVIGGGSSGKKFVCVNYKNKALWAYSATSDVLDLITLGDPDKALIVTYGNMQFMEKSKFAAATASPEAEPGGDDEMELVSPESTPASGEDNSGEDTITSPTDNLEIPPTDSQSVEDLINPDPTPEPPLEEASPTPAP